MKRFAPPKQLKVFKLEDGFGVSTLLFNISGGKHLGEYEPRTHRTDFNLYNVVDTNLDTIVE